MSDKCYSVNNEDFNYTEIEDAIDCAYSGEQKIVTVYEADTVPYKTSDFYRPICDDMRESAYDKGGEYSESFLDCPAEVEAELDASIKKLIEEWSEKHKLRPTFYKVANVKKLKIRLTGETCGDWEIVE